MPVPRLDPARRAPVVLTALLAGAAVAGLGTGALIAAGGGAGARGVPVTAAIAAGSRTTPHPHRTVRAASEIERGTRADIGYLVGAHQEGDGLHVTFDRVLLELGRDAAAYARATGKPDPGPDGVLLVNDNPLTRDLVLAPDVRVVGTRSLAARTTPTVVSRARLLDTIAAHGADVLLDLRYDRLGYVVEVREHDLP